MHALVWFREDLRIIDNTALYHACEKATDGVAAIYFITPSFWHQHNMAPLRIAFLKEGLKNFQKNWRQKIFHSK